MSFLPDLVNVFEVFLPQLLLYPNPSDPLNGEAAALMMRDRPAYEQKVKGDIYKVILYLSLCDRFFSSIFYLIILLIIVGRQMMT